MSAGLHPGNFVRLVAAVALLAASLVQAYAQSDGDAATRAQRLDALFAVLKTAKDQDEARRHHWRHLEGLAAVGFGRHGRHAWSARPS